MKDHVPSKQGFLDAFLVFLNRANSGVGGSEGGIRRSRNTASRF